MYLLKKYLRNKITRLKGSKNVLKINFLYHKYFGESDVGEIGLDFTNKPNRKKIIQDVINRKKYKSYLEIGCFRDELFKNIKCDKKVGVDPYSGGTIRMTSDEFFLENKLNFDFIFIDGLHIYKQVKKDIENSLKFLNDGGVLMLHDCLPNNVYDQAIPRCKYYWNGDVWKAIVEARTFDNLDTYTCYADSGIGIILKRKNRAKLSLKTDDFSKLKFYDYYKNFKGYMNLVEFSELENLF
tara:strand:- start:324 stop:1043 length:720 start_codon:yes stop_codon:yes gene_type:complete